MSNFKEYRNKVVSAAKEATDTAKNADPDKMEYARKTMEDYGTAIRRDNILVASGGVPSYRSTAKAKQRYVEAATSAAISAKKNKAKEGK